ncbi:unnamed protein product [Alternaria alternata]
MKSRVSLELCGAQGRVSDEVSPGPIFATENVRIAVLGILFTMTSFSSVLKALELMEAIPGSPILLSSTIHKDDCDIEGNGDELNK